MRCGGPSPSPVCVVPWALAAGVNVTAAQVLAGQTGYSGLLVVVASPDARPTRSGRGREVGGPGQGIFRGPVGAGTWGRCTVGDLVTGPNASSLG